MYVDLNWEKILLSKASNRTVKGLSVSGKKLYECKRENLREGEREKKRDRERERERGRREKEI